MSGTRRGAGAPQARPPHPALLIATAVALQAIVWALLIVILWIGHIGYGFHDITDSLQYLKYVEAMRQGLLPYRDFAVEYPPLALPLLLLPLHYDTVAAYEAWFSIAMIGFCAAAAAVTTAAAAALWPRDPRRVLATAIAFAIAVAATGAIAANRYDAAVALVIAVTLLLLVRGRGVAAGGVLGAGFALKLTPALLLPLVLIAVPARRAATVVAFVVIAVLPFVPFLVAGGHGVGYPFTYHSERPLQVESVLGAPYLVARLAGASVATGDSHGSQDMIATGTGAVAAASPWLTALAVALVYLLIWRRRAALRLHPERVPVAGLALVLVAVVCSKVLSPQYLVWTLPLVALACAAEGRRGRIAAFLTLGAMLLTQVEFPGLYWRFVAGESAAVAVVLARDALLIAAAVAALLELRRLPRTP